VVVSRGWRPPGPAIMADLCILSASWEFRRHSATMTSWFYYWGRLSQFGEKRLLGTTKTPWVQCHGRTFFGGGVGLASRKGRTLHITSTLSVGRPPRCPSRRKKYRLNVCTPTTKMRKCLLATTNVLCLIFPWGYLHLRLLGPSFALITYPWRTTMLCQPELPAR
jgi:hypothetical protein